MDCADEYRTASFLFLNAYQNCDTRKMYSFKKSTRYNLQHNISIFFQNIFKNTQSTVSYCTSSNRCPSFNDTFPQ